MSVLVSSWVWRNSPTTRGTRLVLLALADHAQDDGSGAYPSCATLARKTRLSERAVWYALESLQKTGQIRREGTVRTGTVEYSVVMGDNLSGGARVAPPRVQELQSGGARVAPEPSFNRKDNARTREEHRCDRCPGGLTLVSAQRLAEHLFVVHGVE